MEACYPSIKATQNCVRGGASPLRSWHNLWDLLLLPTKFPELSSQAPTQPHRGKRSTQPWRTRGLNSPVPLKVWTRGWEIKGRRQRAGPERGLQGHSHWIQDHPCSQSHDPKKAWKAYCGEKVVTSNAVVTAGKCPNPSNTPDREKKMTWTLKNKKNYKYAVTTKTKCWKCCFAA